MSDVALPPVEHRRFNLRRVLTIVATVAVVWLLAWLLGWHVISWFEDLWDTMTGISLGYIVAGLAMQTVQTTAIAYAWVPILRYAYPDVEIPFRPVLASYAIGVALNGFLPANIGTFVMMFLFLTFIPGLDVPRHLRGLPRPEDLLHDRRHVRLPLPVPLDPGLVRPPARERLRPPRR